jgi:hypothetical protein
MSIHEARIAVMRIIQQTPEILLSKFTWRVIAVGLTPTQIRIALREFKKTVFLSFNKNQ